MDESSPVQLLDGSVMITLRNAYAARRQAFSVSKDAGASFGGIEIDETLVSPICEASVARLGSPPAIYFANPANNSQRRDLTIRKSSSQSVPQWQNSTYLVAPGLLFGGYSRYFHQFIHRKTCWLVLL